MVASRFGEFCKRNLVNSGRFFLCCFQFSAPEVCVNYSMEFLRSWMVTIILDFSLTS